MIPISINLKDTFKEFNLSLNQSIGIAEYIKEKLTLELARQWHIQASNNLKTSKEEYRRSLIVVDKGRFEGAVILKGVFPNMVEQGASPFDMKEAFLSSSKAKMGKNGKLYFTIPFRHATPNAGGFSAIFSGILPQEVYEEVKKRGKLSQKTVPEPFDIIDSRPQIITKSNIWEEYTHKSSIFAGLERSVKTYESVTQGQYNSFRRVSSSSDPNMFIHKGIQARNLADKAIQSTNIVDFVDRNVDTYLSILGL